MRTLALTKFSHAGLYQFVITWHIKSFFILPESICGEGDAALRENSNLCVGILGNEVVVIALYVSTLVGPELLGLFFT